jgi:hypothetical protein
VKSTRLTGHGLRKEGQPYRLDLCSECLNPEIAYWRDEHGHRSLTKEGHGLCSCGALSPHLSSDNARRRWHVAHKVEMTR